MALSSLPLTFNGMLLSAERNTSLLASSNVSYRRTQCRVSNKLSNNNTPNIIRRSDNFKPSIWTYDFIQSLSSQYKEEKYLEQSKVLKEEVRIMFGRLENHLDQLEFIEELQRLGVAYHFANEIKNILDNIYKMDAFKRNKSLHATALEFRLLRQHGYDISTDVFGCFQDEMGNFKKSLSSDVEGMLSLYEASFHLLEGETILDEARDFTSQFLKEYLNQDKGDHISLLISHALELPLHWRISRWEAQWFINACDRKQDMSPALIQLAKLDFNTLQAIYQDELKYTSRWWKKTLLVDKLGFCRDRIMENFFWTVGMHFEPNFEYFRRVMTKILALITTIDDVYDVYGALDDLELFTMIIDRWDLKSMDNLPDYMKACFQTLYNFVDEMALAHNKKNEYNITPHLKKSWTDLCKSYFIEAKWFYRGYTPSFGEYMENRENETGDVAKSIQCYMDKTGASEEEACEYVKSILCVTWKKMNKEVQNASLSQSFIDTTLNMGRMGLCMYQHGDGHTIQDLEIKNLIESLIIEPIPMIKSEK